MKSKANVMVLKASEQQKELRFDGVKWLIALVLLVTGLIASYYYREIALVYRLLGWLFILLVSGFMVAKTQKGAQFIEFFLDSRAELRKVVWPTRQETVQTALVVAAMVIILALVLWGLDGALIWLIGWLTGQRG